MAAGIPFGPHTAYHDAIERAGMPASVVVGMSGLTALRVSPVIRMNSSVPRWPAEPKPDTAML